MHRYLKNILKKGNHNTNVGDEGGFAPNLREADEAIDLIIEAIELSGYKVGKDIFLALDTAASELIDVKSGLYFDNVSSRVFLEFFRVSNGSFLEISWISSFLVLLLLVVLCTKEVFKKI